MTKYLIIFFILLAIGQVIRWHMVGLRNKKLTEEVRALQGIFDAHSDQNDEQRGETR